MPVLDPDPGFFRAAVASVLAQTLCEFELLVVEDPGRLAGAALVLSEFDDPRIHHVRNPARTSMAHARNQGLALARADLVAMFDADDLCAPDRLEKQERYLRAHPEVAVLGSQIEVIDAQDRVLGRRRYPTDHAGMVAAMRRYNPLAHPSVMVRAAVCRAAGGYVAPPENVCEDYELWSRLARDGVCFANLPEPLLRYRVHGAASKVQRLRDTLRQTLRIKRTYWEHGMSPRGRLRMWGERALLHLPSWVVTSLFLRTQLRRS